MDTHVLLWWLQNDTRMSPKISDILANPDVRAFVSSASVYEISIKVKLGKMDEAREIELSLLKVVEQEGFEYLAISPEHSLTAGRLNLVHRDPFDRLLAAQSIVEYLPIMTVDKRIDRLGSKTVW